MQTGPSGATATIPSSITFRVVFICWATILFEGYDVGVMGAILPSLSVDRSWALSPLQLGALSSYALMGMFFGSFLIGTLSDLLGRKRMLIACITLFSLTMIGAALAPTPGWFGTFRFLSGLGLGGVIPVAAALTVEYSPPPRRSVNYGLMYSGYSIGIACSALLATILLPTLGWRAVVGIGAIPLVTMPLFAWLLPESLVYLMGSGHQAKAAQLAARLGIARHETLQRSMKPTQRTNWRDVLIAMFSPGYLRATICFWVALFFGMFLVYGLGTWLPQIMRKNGYNLGSSLSFLIVFSLASAIGGIALGRLSDRIGQKPVITVAFLVGGLAIYALSLTHSSAVSYLLVILAGIGSISSSLILTGYLTGYYEPHAAGAATGWALGIARIGAMSGPLIGGYVASLHLAISMNFAVFAVGAFIAALAVALIPGRRRLPGQTSAVAPEHAAGHILPS